MLDQQKVKTVKITLDDFQTERKKKNDYNKNQKQLKSLRLPNETLDKSASKGSAFTNKNSFQQSKYMQQQQAAQDDYLLMSKSLSYKALQNQQQSLKPSKVKLKPLKKLQPLQKASYNNNLRNQQLMQGTVEKLNMAFYQPPKKGILQSQNL